MCHFCLKICWIINNLIDFVFGPKWNKNLLVVWIWFIDCCLSNKLVGLIAIVQMLWLHLFNGWLNGIQTVSSHNNQNILA